MHQRQPASCAIDRVYGGAGACQFGLYRRGAVARQPMRPVLIARLQRLLDDQPAKSGAIDEQVAFDELARVQHQRFDESGFAVLPDFLDLAFNALDAETFGKTAAGILRTGWHRSGTHS